MKKRIISLFLMFCLAITMIPFMEGTLSVSAASKKNVKLSGNANGYYAASLYWNKIKSPNNGYALFRNGVPISHMGKSKTSYYDSNLHPGTSYKYQIKTYKTKKTKQWYNKKTGKWQKKKPKKKYRGKSRNVYSYSYKKKSNTIYVTTPALPKYTITFKNWNGTTLKSQVLTSGQRPTAPANPTRAEDSNYTYTFSDWSPAITNATANRTYTAQFKATAKPAKYTIIFKNWDGTRLETQTLEKGKMPSCSKTPVRPADAEYTYTFSGWSPAITSVTANKTYTATFKATAKPATKYTITWQNWDGSRLDTTTVEKGKVPAYNGTPTRPDDSKYTYKFSGWSPSLTAATANATYTAQYTKTEKPSEEYKIIWEDWNGDVLSTEFLKKGAMPSYTGTPTREDDEYNSYTFTGWTPSVEPVTGPAIYLATYKATPKSSRPETETKFWITWKNYDGTILLKEEYEEGKLPAYNGTVARTEDDNYTYEFIGWAPEISKATKDQEYVAQFKSTKKPTYYDITWKNWDGSTLGTTSAAEGTIPNFTGTPERPADSSNTYTFNGWTPKVSAATGPATYTATYTTVPKPTTYTITWKDWDGTTLKTQPVEKGTIPSYGGKPTRTSDELTYTFTGWSPEVVAANADATYTAQYTGKSKSSEYTYNIKFLNEPYGNGGKTVVYVETNNPSRFNFSLGVIDKNGNKSDGNNYYSFSPLENFEEDYDDMAGLSYDTSGKYIAIVEPKCAGDCQFAIYENKNSSNVKASSKSVCIRDYNAEKTNWEKSVINEVCKAGMTNKEKMQAICGYLLGNFKYFKNDGTYVITLLADEGIPFWKTKRLNSFTSPYLLVEFGKLLNYPLENWYEKYPQGSAEWKVNHMYVYSAADDTQFQACPANDTGTISRDSITIFNPNSYNFWEE